MIKFIKNIFRKKTKEEEISRYGNYLCGCMMCGEISGEEAKEDLLYYITTLDEK